MKTRAALAFIFVSISLTSCWRAEHVPDLASPTPNAAPSAAPEASPSPTYIPQKRLETAKLFNGISVRSTFESDPGLTATAERNSPASYTLDLKLHVNVPKPSTELRELAALNEALPQVLPALDSLVASAKVPPFFERFYALKLSLLQQNLARLDQLPSRHNFFDCETILALKHPDSKRRALLIQADMDIDTDGSDGDRLAPPDSVSPTFQTMTSYKWTKKTIVPNPFLAARETRLKQLETETAKSANRDTRDQLGALRYEIAQLKTNSFLLAAADPYVVLPGWMMAQNGEPFSPRVGDYCVVIFKDTLYPAIIGDVGPRDKIGEASLRLGKEINARATADNRPASSLTVTYLVFPNSADKPFAQPDLAKWSARCEQLLTELGGHAGTLHAWMDLTTPAKVSTPTPSPSASPSASPLATASPTPNP